MVLSDLLAGQTAKIVHIHAEIELWGRMYGMGLRLGQTVEIIRRRRSILQVRIGYTDLVIRVKDAELIEVTDEK